MAEISPATLQQTALHAVHVRWGGRMVEFGGWSMPVQYSGILDEHRAVRGKAGLFDISHMGEFSICGPGAKESLNALLTNDLARLEIGQGQYTLMLNERGGVIDDLIIYRVAADDYFLVVNASKIAEDAAWLRAHLPGAGVTFLDRSGDYGALALQGPQAAEILPAAFGWTETLPARNHIKNFTWQGLSIAVARTGYTGEDGFELFFPNAVAEKVWETLLHSGKEAGLKPCGLGCRDTLRLEACYPLNGQDLSASRTPLEAGLGIFVALQKSADFPGKAVLLEQKTAGLPTKLVALRLAAKGAPPRPHYAIYQENEQVGEVTSGTLSPTLGYGIGLAYVRPVCGNVGQTLQVEIRGQRLPAAIVPKPFYKKS